MTTSWDVDTYAVDHDEITITSCASCHGPNLVAEGQSVRHIAPSVIVPECEVCHDDSGRNWTVDFNRGLHVSGIPGYVAEERSDSDAFCNQCHGRFGVPRVEDL